MAKKATKSKSKFTKPTPKAAQKPAALGAGVWPSAGFNTFTASTTPKNMENFMNKSQSQFDSLSRDQAAMWKETAEACMKSGKITAERMQDMMNTYVQFCQECTEKQTQAMKDLMSCKTMTDLTDYQTKYAQNSFDDMMQAMTRMTEMAVKATTEAMEPINDQVGKAMKKASSAMAA